MYSAHRFLDDLCPVPDDEEPDDGRDDDHVEWPEVVTWHKIVQKNQKNSRTVSRKKFTFVKEFTKKARKPKRRKNEFRALLPFQNVKIEMSI